MAALTLDIVNYLVDNGAVTAAGTDGFSDFVPESPDAVVSVYEYSGGSPDFYNNVATRAIQIVARAKTIAAARSKAQEIYNLFRVEEDASEETIQITVTRWAVCFIRQVPYKLKVDEQGRVYYAFNMYVTTNTD